MKRLFVLVFAMVLLASCTVDVPMLRAKGKIYLEGLGFEVVGYEGFQWGIWGGKCWFMIRDPSAAGARHSVYLIERRGEIHLYSSTVQWADNKTVNLEK